MSTTSHPTHDLNALCERAQKAAQAIYIAVEPEVAGDINEILEHLVAAVRGQEADKAELMLEVWQQFSEPVTRNGWNCDMGRSTLGWIAEDLVQRGALEKHKSKDWYRRATARVEEEA